MKTVLEELLEAGVDVLRFIDAMPEREQHKWFPVIQNFREALARAAKGKQLE